MFSHIREMFFPAPRVLPHELIAYGSDRPVTAWEKRECERFRDEVIQKVRERNEVRHQKDRNLLSTLSKDDPRHAELEHLVWSRELGIPSRIRRARRRARRKTS